MEKIVLTLLLIFSLKLFSYPVEVKKIDNDFISLTKNRVEKFIYFYSDIPFSFKKGDIYNLYRWHKPEKDSKEKKNGEKKGKKDKKDKNKDLVKLCIAKIKIVENVEQLTKAIAIGKCKDKPFFTTFETVKLGDFIEVETIFDKKDKKTKLSTSEKIFTNSFSAIFMLYIDDQFNILLERREQFFEPIVEDKKVETRSKKYKKLPRKKRKRKKNSSMWDISL